MDPTSNWESLATPVKPHVGMKLELTVLEGVELSLYDKDNGYNLWSVSVGRNLFDAARALRKKLLYVSLHSRLDCFLVKACSVLYVDILGRAFVLDYLGSVREIQPEDFQALFTREDLEILKHRRRE